MSKFISRKALEVSHSKTYKMKEKLKELGCEWDAIAKAWIAPSLEVKELCYQLLEEAENTTIKRPCFGQCGWDNVPTDWSEAIGEPAPPLEPVKSIAYTPSYSDAQKICGEENVKRYWHPSIPSEAASLLASGKNKENAIYQRLEEEGWKSRQVSLLLDVVNHFRQHPPIPALDTDNPPILSTTSVNPIEMNGSIGVICDSNRNPVAFTVTFPYSNQMVNRVKWLPGRKWNPAKKRWEVPIDSKYGQEDTLAMFPHFQRSPKAQELEKLEP
jgi:hypothetical protein